MASFLLIFDSHEEIDEFTRMSLLFFFFFFYFYFLLLLFYCDLWSFFFLSHLAVMYSIGICLLFR
jgi:hypothetical protein